MKNALLTSSGGINFGEREHVFFNSLKKVYSGDVFVFTNNTPTEEFLKNANLYGFFVIPYPCRIHYCVDRNFYMKLFLERHTEYEKIFISDCGDVIWQTDPFDFDEEIEFAPENITFDQCKINKDWIDLMYGKEYSEKLTSKLVSCAGTIRGSYEEIYKYLCFQTKELENVTINLDQATHNRYLYEKKKGNMKNLQQSKIFTAGYADTFVFNSQAQLINDLNEPYCCIHQYVHKEILVLLSKKYC